MNVSRPVPPCPAEIAQRVLVVDDDRGFQALIVKTLNKAGYQTVGAATGAEAIASILQHGEAVRCTACVLLLDQRLPDMTGREVIDKLAADGLMTPFIIMTGQGDERLAVEMMKLGAADYLVKDIDFLDLLPGVLERVFRNLQTEQRLRSAERALQESEAKYRLLIEQASDAIFLHDQTGRILDVNRKACESLGYTRQELFAMSVMQVNPWITQAELTVLWQRVFAGEEFKFESQHRCKDGSFIPVEVALGSVSMPTGQAILAIVRDITDRKRAAEALRQSEEKFRKAFMISPDSININRLSDGLYVSINQGFTQIMGYTEADAIGKTSLELHIWDDPEDRKRLLEGLQNNGVVQNLEARFRRKDGGLKDGLMSASIINLNGAPHILSITRDITERKRAEEALQKSETLYRRAIEVAGAVPYLQSYDESSTSVYYDFIGEGIRQITGYGPEEFTDQLWNSITEERKLLEDLAAYPWNEAVRRVRAGESPIWKCEHRIRARDGKVHWVFEAAVELMGKNGMAYGSIGLFQDITARKQVEESLQLLNEQLEQRILERTVQLDAVNKDLEAFSYSVSHDLRAPLRAIDGFARMLQELQAEQLSEGGRELLTRILVNTKRAGAMIDDLLRFSRLGRQAVVKQTVDMGEIVRSALGTFQIEQEKQPQIILHDLPACQGDPSLLMQVWINLFSNAFKYSRKRDHAEIEAGCQVDEKGEAIYYIKDNGVGFDMRYANKLFGVFQRLHSESQFEGTGVGLALVQRIISRHGGRIWAEAEPDKGATFYFTL